MHERIATPIEGKSQQDIVRYGEQVRSEAIKERLLI